MINKMTIFLAILLLAFTAQASQSTATDQSSLQTIEITQVDLSLGIDQSETLSTEQNCDSTIDPITGEVMLAQVCCKTCRKGKACGNSCISRDKQCHQPPGCACDG